MILERPRRHELYVGFDKAVSIDVEFLNLKITATGEARRLFAPRHLLRVVSGPKAQWHHAAIQLMLSHRLGIVFVNRDEQPIGCLQPHNSRHYDLDDFLVAILQGQDGPERLRRWTQSREHGVAAHFLQDQQLVVGEAPLGQVVYTLQHTFRQHCLPLDAHALEKRFELICSLFAYRCLGNGKLSGAVSTGALRGFGLRGHFARLVGLEARRLLLQQGWRLPDQARLLPGYFEQHLQAPLAQFHGRLLNSLWALV